MALHKIQAIRNSRLFIAANFEKVNKQKLNLNNVLIHVAISERGERCVHVV